MGLKRLLIVIALLMIPFTIASMEILGNSNNHVVELAKPSIIAGGNGSTINNYYNITGGAMNETYLNNTFWRRDGTFEPLVDWMMAGYGLYNVGNLTVLGTAAIEILTGTYVYVDFLNATEFTQTTNLNVTGKILNSNLTETKGVFTNDVKELTSTGTLGGSQGGTGATTFNARGVIIGGTGASGTPLTSVANPISVGSAFLSSGSLAYPAWSSWDIPSIFGASTVGNKIIVTSTNSLNSVPDITTYKTFAETTNSTDVLRWITLFETYNLTQNTNYTFDCYIWVGANGTVNGVQFNLSANQTLNRFAANFNHPTTTTATVFRSCANVAGECVDSSATSVAVPASLLVTINSIFQTSNGVNTNMRLAFKPELNNSIAVVYEGSYCNLRPLNS